MIAVMSADLMPLLEPHIEKWTLEGFAKTVAASTGLEWSPKAVVRRIFEIRSGRQVMCNVHSADTYLLACDDFSSLAELPHFPLDHTSARDMVAAHFETRNERPTRREVETLARTLLHFARGVKDEAMSASETAQAHQKQAKAYAEQKQALRAAAAGRPPCAYEGCSKYLAANSAPNARFCSYQCRNNHNQRRYRRESWEAQGIQRAEVCMNEECGAPIPPLKKLTTKFCSSKCRDHHNAKRRVRHRTTAAA